MLYILQFSCTKWYSVHVNVYPHIIFCVFSSLCCCCCFLTECIYVETWFCMPFSNFRFLRRQQTSISTPFTNFIYYSNTFTNKNKKIRTVTIDRHIRFDLWQKWNVKHFAWTKHTFSCTLRAANVIYSINTSNACFKRI